MLDSHESIPQITLCFAKRDRRKNIEKYSFGTFIDPEAVWDL